MGERDVPRITWDPEQPPVEPPAGADVLVWRLSHRLLTDHTRSDSDGFCLTCRAYSPCRQRRLAERGLIVAVARFDPPPNAAAGRY
jgi:hypothetical protein